MNSSLKGNLYLLMDLDFILKVRLVNLEGRVAGGKDIYWDEIPYGLLLS